MLKVIVREKLLYQAQVVDPDQAMWIAKRNGSLSAETFTLRYDGRRLVIDSTGALVKPGDTTVEPTLLIVKDHLIYNVRVIPAFHADNIARANGLLSAERFVKKYEGATLTLDAELKIVRNQSAEIKTSINGEKHG